MRLDVTRESDWQRAVTMAEEVYKRLDILVNNAGVSATGNIEDTTVEEWDRVMEVNAKGVFLGTKHAIPACSARRRLHHQHLVAAGHRGHE